MSKKSNLYHRHRFPASVKADAEILDERMSGKTSAVRGSRILPEKILAAFFEMSVGSKADLLGKKGCQYFWHRLRKSILPPDTPPHS